MVWAQSASDTHMLYVLYIYTLGFLVPMAIIVTSYVKIIKTIKIKVCSLALFNLLLFN